MPSRTLTSTLVLSCLLTMAVLAESPALAAAQPQESPAGAPVVVGGIEPPADYMIGPEDVLGVLFWRETEMSGDVTVRPDGRITLPLIGDVVAAGLTPAALKATIQGVAAKFLTDPNATIVVREIKSRQVFITGEVASPGAYALTGPRTVMQLIALAGGVNEFADKNAIAVIRIENGQQRRFTFKYDDVARGKSLQQNILLKPGDTVVVP